MTWQSHRQLHAQEGERRGAGREPAARPRERYLLDAHGLYIRHITMEGFQFVKTDKQTWTMEVKCWYIHLHVWSQGGSVKSVINAASEEM